MQNIFLFKKWCYNYNYQLKYQNPMLSSNVHECNRNMHNSVYSSKRKNKDTNLLLYVYNLLMLFVCWVYTIQMTYLAYIFEYLLYNQTFYSRSDIMRIVTYNKKVFLNAKKCNNFLITVFFAKKNNTLCHFKGENAKMEYEY